MRDDQSEADLYLGGELVPPGDYRRMGFNETFHLAETDYLPASMDGHVAVYMRVYFWSEHLQHAKTDRAQGSAG